MISVICLRSAVSLDSARINMGRLPGLRGSSSISLVRSRRSSSDSNRSSPGDSEWSFAGGTSSSQQNRCSSSCWTRSESDDRCSRLLLCAGLNRRVSVAAVAGGGGANKPDIQEKKPGIHCLRINVYLKVTVYRISIVALCNPAQPCMASEKGFSEHEHQLAHAGHEAQERADQNQLDFVFLETGAQQILEFFR